MGKQSKHMKHKCIFLQDLRNDIGQTKGPSSKAMGAATYAKNAEIVMAAYVKKYDTSRKSRLM